MPDRERLASGRSADGQPAFNTQCDFDGESPGAGYTAGTDVGWETLALQEEVLGPFCHTSNELRRPRCADLVTVGQPDARPPCIGNVEAMARDILGHVLGEVGQLQSSADRIRCGDGVGPLTFFCDACQCKE